MTQVQALTDFQPSTFRSDISHETTAFMSIVHNTSVSSFITALLYISNFENVFSCTRHTFWIFHRNTIPLPPVFQWSIIDVSSSSSNSELHIFSSNHIQLAFWVLGNSRLSNWRKKSGRKSYVPNITTNINQSHSREIMWIRSSLKLCTLHFSSSQIFYHYT